MVIDSSAFVAIALREEGWDILLTHAGGSQVIVAAPTLLETHLVLRSRLGEEAPRVIEFLLAKINVEVVAFSLEHYRAASIAFDRFGKGRHRAALNFGDCISYALCRVSGQPLLFVGEDFPLTDCPLFNGRG